MKAHLTKVSLALLSTVFLLGCQDMGSGVEPVDLGPQFNKPADPNDTDAQDRCAEQDGFIFDEKGHCHAGEDETADPTFSVVVTGDVSTDPNAPIQIMTGSSFFKEDFFLDISFFNNLGVENGDNCTLSINPTDPTGPTVPTTGLFSVANGDAGGPHVHVVFEFMHKEIKHTLAMDGVPVPLNDVWDPTQLRTATNAPSGHWTMTAKGKGHQNGCKGEEDGTPDTNDGVSFTLTIDPNTP